MSREAMKQAVATFEKIVDGCNGIDEGQDVHSEAKKVARLVMKDCLPALKALCQALEQEKNNKSLGLATRDYIQVARTIAEDRHG